jgi:hypothetical protein
MAWGFIGSAVGASVGTLAACSPHEVKITDRIKANVVIDLYLIISSGDERAYFLLAAK